MGIRSIAGALICLATYCILEVSSEVSAFLPYGNHVGIGLSFPMVITVKPDMCINCPMMLEVVPPYFTNSQTNQPMLNLENCIVRYIGSNIFGASITAGDFVDSSPHITVKDGVLSLDFGVVDIPAGSTDTEIIVSLDVQVRNMYTIQSFNVLTLQIKEQLNNQYNFVKESLQVVKPDLPLIQTFEPEASGVLYQSKDEPAIIFSVKLPATSPSPVYNISITCSVTDASPNFLTATTNPNSVSIVVVEQDGQQLIHFLADELRPGHVIVGRFGVYLQNSLAPDHLYMVMSVVSFGAPIQNNGRQLDTVQSNLIVPLKLKYPTLKLIDYPDACLVGMSFNVTLSVELPPLLVNYKVDFSALFGMSSAATFLSVTKDSEVVTGRETITDNSVELRGEGMLEEESSVLYTITARVKSSLQIHHNLLISTGLTYESDSRTKTSNRLEQEIVVQHPDLDVQISSSEEQYVTLGEAVSYTLSITHSRGSAADAHKVLLTVELSVPGILNCQEDGLSVSQLTGRKIQVSEDHLGVGEVLKISISATPTADDMLQNKMKLLVTYTYQSCPSSYCQTYSPTTAKESTGLKIHSTDIGTEFVPASVAVKHPFSLKILPVRDTNICEYNATITLPSSDITLRSVNILPYGAISVSNLDNKVKINMSPSAVKVDALEVKFGSNVVEPGRLHTFGLRSSFKLCNSDLVMEETTSHSIEIVDASVDITITASIPKVQCKTEFSYQISFAFDRPIPVYNMTVLVVNRFVKFSSTDSRITTNSDGFALFLSHFDTDTVFNVSGLAEDITLTTDTTASWSYQYFSAPLSGITYTGAFALPNTNINQPTFSSFIENKASGKVTIGEEFVFGIEVLTSEMVVDFTIRFQIPECNGAFLFEVVDVPNPVVGADVYLNVPPTHQTGSGVLEIFLQANNRANSYADKGDLVTQRVRFRSLFSMLQCQNTTFPIVYTVDYGLAPTFDSFEDTKYLELSGPDLETQFSIIPSLKGSHDAKDIMLFDLKLWHAAKSSAPAYNITVQLVCEELNVLGFSIITPPPRYLEQGTVSVRFGVLSVGETFAAIVRAELKKDVKVARKIGCGGKVDYMSSDNEPSMNYIYTTTFLSNNIQLALPRVSLWDVGNEGNMFEYSVEVEVPEGRLPSLIITLNVGMGISIVDSQIQHLSLASTTLSAVVIQNTAAQIDLGEVYNKPDNLETDEDLISVTVMLSKNLPFADLGSVYVTLGDGTKSHAVAWSDECNLQINLVRRDDKEFVEGGDEIQYDAVVSHDIRSQVNCVDGRIHLLLDNCEVRMDDQFEIRSKGGIRKMVYIEKNADSAIFRLDSIELGDEYTVPITVHISDTIHPGTKLSLQSYIMYKSETAGALQRRSRTSYADIVLSSVPQATAVLITQHNSDAVSIGETVQIQCLIALPKGLMDLTVHAVGDGTDSVIMAGISSNMTTLSYENLQKTQGLNHGLISYTQLYNPPDDAISVVLFTIAPRIYDSVTNVDGERLSLKLVVGYSLTERNMIEDALLFTLKIVEPVLVVMSSVTPSVEAELVYITLHYSHSTPPYLKTSSANAYRIYSEISLNFDCSSDSPGVSVVNDTVLTEVLELGEELTIQLACKSSPLMELGKQTEIVIDTTYSSNSENGRFAHYQVKTGSTYASREPTFELSIMGLDGVDEIKLNEAVAVEFTIMLPVGIFPNSKIIWRSSDNLLFSVKSCFYDGTDVIKKTTRNSLGEVSEMKTVTNNQPSNPIKCSGTLTTLGGPDATTGSVTIAVNYGVNTGVTTQHIQINVPRLEVNFEVADVTAVQGNDKITAKFTISHLAESTGDAYNFWLNTTSVGAKIGDNTSLDIRLAQVILFDTRSFSFSLSVNSGLMPLTPVFFVTQFGYSTSPSSATLYSLPDFEYNELHIRDLEYDVTSCKGEDKVSVGGFGFICISITLPVCETEVAISVKHPMSYDRELAEVVDGAKVAADNTFSTKFTQIPVRHLITRSDLSISDIRNIGIATDTLSVVLPILVFADEKVFDTDIVKFTLTIHHKVYGGKKTNSAEVAFTVTEPHLIVHLSILDAKGETYQKDDSITIRYTIEHTPASLTPAYNIKLKSNSTMFSDLAEDIILSELGVGDQKHGTVELLLTELPEFGAQIEVMLVVEYSSTPTDVGRRYFDVGAAGVIDISRVSASLELSHEKIPIGQTFTVLSTVVIPKAKGNVSVTIHCEEFCQYVGELRLLENGEDGAVQGNTLRLVEASGGRELELELHAVLTNETRSRAEISVEVNGEVVKSNVIHVAEISLELSDMGTDIQIVDAGNNLAKSFDLLFNGTVYDTTTALSCIFTSSSTLTCEDSKCQILATTSNDLPDATDVTCEVNIGFLSHPTLGREYTFVKQLVIGRSPSVAVDVEPASDPVSVGNTLESLLKINVTEVVASVEVEILCTAGNEDFIITSMELVTSLDSVAVAEEEKQVTPSCGRVTVQFSPVSPKEDLHYQVVYVRTSLIYTKQTNTPALVNYKVTIGSNTSVLTQNIASCSPDFILNSRLLTETPYVSSEEAISYKSTIKNVGSCSFYLARLRYDTLNDFHNVDTENVIVLPGQELEFDYTVKEFPKGLVVLEPELTAFVVTSLLPEFTININRNVELPAAYLISPLPSISPSQLAVLPYQKLLLTLDLYVPYLIDGAGHMSVFVESTQGSVVEFEEVDNAGSELSVTTTSTANEATQTFSITKPHDSSVRLTTATLLSLRYSLQVTDKAASYTLTFTTTLGDTSTVLSKDVDVLSPDLGVKMKSGHVGTGYIPGDIVQLSLTVEHSEGSTSKAVDPVLLVTTPPICQDSTVLTTGLQVRSVNSTTLSIELPDIALDNKISMLMQCKIPDTTDTEGKSYTYNVQLSYRSPILEVSSWSFSKIFQRNLQLGEPAIRFNITTTPSPNTSQTIRCQVLLRKGSSELTINLTLSQDLVLQQLSITEVGNFLSFDSTTGDVNLDNDDVVARYGDDFALFLGIVTCSNETKDRSANSFVLELTVLIATSSNAHQYVTGSVQFGRGEDTATLPINVLIPELDVTMECHVDNVTCDDVIEVNSQSRVKYTVKLYHTLNSTGPAYNVILQLYIPLFDLNIVSTKSSLGALERSGLGVKLTKRELQTTDVVMWETVMAVRDYESFSDCSTAIVSLYDVSESDNSFVEMLPIVINFFTPKLEESLPYPEMYGKGILGSEDHEYLYICNTTCFAIARTGELIKLNSEIHSLIGVTVTRTQYILYGVSQNGAYVMSTSLDKWISIPHEIWAGLEEKVEPKTAPWPQTVETSLGAVYRATETGVSLGNTVVFYW